MGRDHGNGIPRADFLTEPAANALWLVDDAGGVQPRVVGSGKLIDAIHRTDRNAHLTACAAVGIDERFRTSFSRLRGRGCHRYFCLALLEPFADQLADHFSIGGAASFPHDIFHHRSLVGPHSADRFLDDLLHLIRGELLREIGS